MNIVIINGSHRFNGNCAAFSNTARDFLKNHDHRVELFTLIQLNVLPCTGCLSCEDALECPLHDDFSSKIEPALKKADLIIMATPTYFNMPSAAMVNYINRTNKLCEYFAANHKKCLFYVVGQTDENTIRDAYNCLHTFGEVMEMEEIAEPIIQVARMPEAVSSNIFSTLEMI